MRFVLLFFLASPALLHASQRPSKRQYDTYDYYVIRHDPSHGHSPDQSATALGAELMERVGELKDHWLIRTKKSPESLARRDLNSAHKGAAVARYHSLKKRGDPLAYSVRELHPQVLRQRTKRAPIPVFPKLDDIVSSLDIHDPIFSQQWHIINSENPEHMMNVTGLWKEGVTGKGVISSLVDDGLDYTSKDLAPNFYAEGSYDFNDHEDLPTPKLWDDKHGTRCAGEIAAAKNDVCGVGIAYQSKVAGLRILSGPITDVDEAAALNYGYQESSIYSCSWGPPDSGRDMEGPNILIQRAVLNGINHGRGGKGSIFVFASGNGAASGDACNFDGYTNSIYSVTVGAIDHKGLHPYYSEACAANMIVTYSSGSGKHISTTDVGETTCSHTHGGTSAAAPLAVGVFALALEVRPDLTWRDIQHICVRSAAPINPEDPDWETTAVGRKFSYKYGFGKLDAYAFVSMARNWQNVKPQAWMEMPTIELADARMVDGEMLGGELIGPRGVSSEMVITKEMMDDHNLEKLEHITVKVWIDHDRRGDVEVSLFSPAGIESVLATKRSMDSADTGFVGWTFMTLKHWDENPVGTWKLKVLDQVNENKGYVLGWSMTFWGSSIDPDVAELYELPDEPNEGHNLPPHPTSTDVTKQHPKPTQALPEDHASQNSETSLPAATPTGAQAAEEGYFTNMYNLLSNQLWLVGAIGIVVIFGICAGVFLWLRKRRIAKARSAYAPLPGGDNMPMRSLERGAPGAAAGSGAPGNGERSAGGTRELYDAFGVGSDEDEEDEDEHTALTSHGRSLQARQAGYHDGFIDDEGLSTGRSTRTPYRDNPVGETSNQREESGSPRREGSDGSGDGSWQDAAEGAHAR